MKRTRHDHPIGGIDALGRIKHSPAKCVDVNRTAWSNGPRRCKHADDKRKRGDHCDIPDPSSPVFHAKRPTTAHGGGSDVSNVDDYWREHHEE